MENNKHYTVAEAADIILNHLVECGQPCDDKRIKRDLFPDMSSDHISHVLKYIKDFPLSAQIVTEHKYNDGGLKATSLAKDLLSQGGFANLQKEIDEQKEKDSIIKERQLQLSDLQIADLVDKVIQNPKINARAKRLEYWTVASIILAVAAIIVSIVKR